jgi:hypothetical protein
VAVKLLLLLQHKHEVVPKTALHHHPVHSTRQIDVGGQEDDIFALQGCDTFVHLHQVRHHLFKAALPLAASTRARTRVRSKLASLLMINLLSMEEGDSAAAAGVLAGEHYCGSHLLHSEVPNVPSKLASAGGAAGELRPTVGADKVARVALKYWGEDIVEANRTLE